VNAGARLAHAAGSRLQVDSKWEAGLLLAELVVWDDRLVVWANHLVGRWSECDLFIAWLVKTHLPRFVPLILAMCWLWFKPHPTQPARREVLLEALMTSVFALFVARALALLLPFRERPLGHLELGLAMPASLDTGLRTWSSFPSDHAVLAFALAVSLWRVSRPIGAWALFHATVFICLPRLVVGFHFPSDLIAGAALGSALALLVPLLRLRHAITDFLLKVEVNRPATMYSVGFFVLFEMAEMFDSVRAVAAHVFKVLRGMLG
jgi:undecaprenyl-diphosphatase